MPTYNSNTTNKKPTMIDRSIYDAAGVPYSKAARKYGIYPGESADSSKGRSGKKLSKEQKLILKRTDRMQYMHRFKWYGIPTDIPEDFIENLIYSRGQGVFFFHKDSFYFLPFALSGTIDVYGRYEKIHPLPWANGSADDKNEDVKKWKTYLESIKLEPLYQIMTEVDLGAVNTKCVILRDYTPQYGVFCTPRCEIVNETIAAEAKFPAYVRAACKNGTGLQGIATRSPEDVESIKAQSVAADSAAEEGDRFIGISTKEQLQSLQTANILDISQFAMGMQMFDNLRLASAGIINGGLFEKQGTVIQDEVNVHTMNYRAYLEDCLSKRREFCAICNSLYGTEMWVDIAEDMQEELAMLDDMEIGNDYEGDGYEGDGGDSDGNVQQSSD